MSIPETSVVISNSMGPTPPKVYYGMHFVDGIVGYPELKTPECPEPKVFLNERTLTDMDQTFQGCPVYVDHKDDAPLADMPDPDGYVVRSFRNEVDGKHWAEFLIVSEKGHQAIKQGLRLSNAYRPESYGPGGIWNGIPYQKEVTKGRFHHLALVRNPRYAESTVLDFSQFQSYNKNLQSEQSRVRNELPSESQTPLRNMINPLLKFFVKNPATLPDNFEASVLSLPSGKEISFGDLVQNAISADKEKEPSKMNADEKEDPKDKKPEEKKDAKAADAPEAKPGDAPTTEGDSKPMADMTHHVLVNGTAMPLSEVMEKHQKMLNCMNTLSEHHAGMAKEEAAGADGVMTPEKSIHNGTPEKKPAPVVDNKNFETLANAHLKSTEQPRNYSSLNSAALGNSRYGSK